MKKRLLLCLAVLLPLMQIWAQPDDSEWADPKPGDQQTWNAQKGVTLGWGSTDVRYSRSQPAKGTASLKLKAWKGERVSAQAVLSTNVNLQKVRFDVSDLKCGSQVISADNIRKYFVRYVMTDWHNNKKDSFLLADRLAPLGEMSVAAKTTRPLWLDVRVPITAKAGLYKGTLTLQADGKKMTLPIQLQVLDHVLPAPSEWGFHLDLWQNPYAVARYYQVPLWSQQHFDIMRPLMTSYAEAGGKVITCSIIQHPWNSQTFDPFESMIAKMKQIDGSWKYDYTVFDRWVEFMMSCGIREQIDCYTLVPWQYKFDYYDCATNSTKLVECKPKEAAYRDLILPFLRDFAHHLKQKGWFDITCIAMDERPMDQLEAAWKVVQEADPGYRIEGAANYNIEGDIAGRMYDLSVEFDYDLLKPEALAQRAAKGQKITFYTCCVPDRPNTFTFSDPAESAYLGWHALACGYDGYLRWAFNSWQKNPCQDSRTPRWPSGDANLVYPGESSIRMERLVEGIQAYEKIKLLRPNFTEAQNQQLEEILKPFRVTKYDVNVPAADLVNKASSWLNNQ
jgi:hypothetical protein